MKFIFYLILFYIIYRFIRAIMRTRVVIKSFHYQDNRTYHGPQDPEGKVTIKNPGNPKKPGQISPDSGEYVDYEEVKD